MNDKAPSAVEHDEEWLADNDPEESIVGVDNIVAFSSWEDIQLYAKQYAEHLTDKLQADNEALRERIGELEAALKLVNNRYQACKFYELDMVDINDARVDELALTQCFSHPLLRQSS